MGYVCVVATAQTYKSCGKLAQRIDIFTGLDSCYISVQSWDILVITLFLSFISNLGNYLKISNSYQDIWHCNVTHTCMCILSYTHVHLSFHFTNMQALQFFTWSYFSINYYDLHTIICT